VDDEQELIQLTERALFEAEEALRSDPSEANRRRAMDAWSAVQKARGGDGSADSGEPRPDRWGTAGQSDR
jgi:hypothetical protein